MITSEFLTAGKAIFTVENMTGDHWTFRISECKDNPEISFVGLLTGPNNTSDYTYLGLFVRQTNEVKLTKASRYTDESKPVQIIRRVVARIMAGQGEVIEAAGWKVHHIGRCGHCGRPLTTPESIVSGIGPICAGR